MKKPTSNTNAFRRQARHQTQQLTIDTLAQVSGGSRDAYFIKVDRDTTTQN